ncbi:MAG: carbonic anhydrase [Bacteroidetes bacterium]|nr:MAG: carbonic anhydrase [Bacteroidota bacterium]
MDIIDKIFLQNKAWAEDKLHDDPDFFKTLKTGQKPDFFWIGCSDSRVPANEITNTASGQIFVHRNIANMVVNTDMNLMSGLQFAIEELKVKHVIVCGHYGCGGVKAALSNKHHGLINKWIRNIKDVYRLHRDEIDSVPNDDRRVNKLVELNVIEQTQNVAKTSIVQQAWHTGDGPHLHGWVYDLGDGLLKSLIHIKPGDPIDPIYKFSDLEVDD